MIREAKWKPDSTWGGRERNANRGLSTFKDLNRVKDWEQDARDRKELRLEDNIWAGT